MVNEERLREFLQMNEEEWKYSKKNIPYITQKIYADLLIVSMMSESKEVKEEAKKNIEIMKNFYNDKTSWEVHEYEKKNHHTNLILREVREILKQDSRSNLKITNELLIGMDNAYSYYLRAMTLLRKIPLSKKNAELAYEYICTAKSMDSGNALYMEIHNYLKNALEQKYNEEMEDIKRHEEINAQMQYNVKKQEEAEISRYYSRW